MPDQNAVDSSGPYDYGHRDLAAKTAAFAAAATVGATFAPSLIRRSPMDQAVATGVSASLSYGIANLTQSFIDGFSRRIAPGRDRSRTESRKYLNAIANLTAIGIGVGLQRVFVARPGEPAKRAAARTLGWEVTVNGVAGLGITAAVGAVETVARRRGGRVHPAFLPVGFLVGAGISAAEIARYRRHSKDPQPVLKSLGQGVGVMVGVSAVAFGETQAARGIAALVRRWVPVMSVVAEPIGHAVCLGVIGSGAWLGMEYAYRSVEQGGAAIEAAYNSPPTVATVSGGPESDVEWNTLSREGRRFVNMVMSPAEIESVTGRPATSPVRAFVGLDSAPSVDQRVSLLMDEMERLGAFDRSVLCLTSPTGTGYINYVVAETLELLTDGDCATVGLQYSLRPSFLSLDRVKVGREQNRALLHAINARIHAMPAGTAPKLVAFGESLGAFTLQDAFLHEGTSGLHRVGIERALFIGTPAGSKWAEQWRLDPQRYDPQGEVVEIDGVAEWDALPEPVRQRARYFLLSHHEDPITKFSPDLMVQAPDWMAEGPTRSPAIPAGVGWRPFTTFILTTVDMKNATNVVPGKFEAFGHDYRADLVDFTSIAFGIPADREQLRTISSALCQRELYWAEQRLVAEQMAQAKEAINRQLSSWGATSDSLPGAFSGFAGLSSGSSGS